MEALNPLARHLRSAVVLAAAALWGCAGAAEDAFRRTPVPSYSYAPPYQWGRASFYTDRLAGRATATGEPYDPSAFTAAHRTLPLGTVVHVARPDGRHVAVRINDRGPYVDGRIIDLSRRAAAELGMLREGVVDVALWVLWVPPPRAQPR